MPTGRGRHLPRPHIRVDRSAQAAYAPAMVEDVDARGLKCPLPVLKLRKRLEALPPGARLRLIADDPVAAIDVPHFCREAGHVLEETAEAEGAQSYLVRRGG